MCYEDFIYFLLCDQDRNNDRSISYWFKVMDIDSDGFIRPWEMKHFFEEQGQRLSYLGYEAVRLRD
jgi:serine/threonine-protein phosphatase 2A regulatory subunit B''